MCQTTAKNSKYNFIPIKVRGTIQNVSNQFQGSKDVPSSRLENYVKSEVDITVISSRVITRTGLKGTLGE